MKIRLLRFLATAGFVFGAGGFSAASASNEPSYFNDRSTPQTVILSLYNAINRHEYKRAWSYFAQPPGRRSYRKFAAGYKTTRYVRVKLGDVAEDAGAGHTFYSVPTVIEAQTVDGKRTVYAGCYQLIHTNSGALPDPSMPNPIMIMEGKFRKSPSSFIKAVGACASN